jgi:hypothetical protein
VADRQYRPVDYRCIAVDDISTTTGLVVKLDEDDDGVFETTLTITTDFILEPFNAADEVPVWPYDAIRLVSGYNYPCLASGRPSVQVSAKFGWPAVPDDIAEACRIQAKNLYKATSGAFQGFQVSAETGAVMRTPGLDYVAMALLEQYRKGWVG